MLKELDDEEMLTPAIWAMSRYLIALERRNLFNFFKTVGPQVFQSLRYRNVLLLVETLRR
jgi:hypothetical protein